MSVFVTLDPVAQMRADAAAEAAALDAEEEYAASLNEDWGVFARVDGRDVVVLLSDRTGVCEFAKQDSRLFVRRASAADKAAYREQW